MNDLLGWLGNVGFLYGAYALGKRKVSGWLAQILANSFYVIQSVFMDNSPLLIVSVILIGVNISGYLSWTRKPKKPKQSIDKQLQNDAYKSYITEIMRHNDNDI